MVLCCWAAWSKWASTTRIGLVNFQNYQTASLVKSNEDNFIEYEEIPLDRLDRLGRYDLVLGFGMGLKSLKSSERRSSRQPTKAPLSTFTPPPIRKRHL